ncbi:uncharacterized protein LOC118615052 [Rousettus aegyptiacus]|uniref:uncharacterized protein LOC118615052 n=1 Tax=Rousettus aegyptiacus TaxID=9407 RepID=UPI00168D68E3|nr:uncharacterized protein LOC118615052 [Rousettus aegyptiacus]
MCRRSALRSFSFADMCLSGVLFRIFGLWREGRDMCRVSDARDTLHFFRRVLIFCFPFPFLFRLELISYTDGEVAIRFILVVTFPDSVIGLVASGRPDRLRTGPRPPCPWPSVPFTRAVAPTRTSEWGRWWWPTAAVPVGESRLRSPPGHRCPQPHGPSPTPRGPLRRARSVPALPTVPLPSTLSPCRGVRPRASRAQPCGTVPLRRQSQRRAQRAPTTAHRLAACRRFPRRSSGRVICWDTHGARGNAFVTVPVCHAGHTSATDRGTWCTGPGVGRGWGFHALSGDVSPAWHPRACGQGFHGPRRSRLGAGPRAPSLRSRLTLPDDSPHPGATRVASAEQRMPRAPRRVWGV